MAGDPERERLEAFAARLRQAKPEARAPGDKNVAADFKASRLGFDFVVTVVACTGFGWLVDWEFGTAPWGLLGLMLVGFVAGIARLWRALNNKG